MFSVYGEESLSRLMLLLEKKDYFINFHFQRTENFIDQVSK